MTVDVHPLRFVIIASDPEDARFASRVLEDHGDSVKVARDVAESLSLLTRGPVDIALVSLTLPRGDGLALVHHLRALHPQVDVIVMGGPEDMQEAAHAMALGVLAHVMQPLTGDALLVAADRARERRMLIAERARLAADGAQSMKRTATYARCAAFVAETDPTTVARFVLEACTAEVPSSAAALFRRDVSLGSGLARMATMGDGDFPPKLPSDAVSHIDPTQIVHRVDSTIRVALLGETDLEAIVDLVPEPGVEVGEDAVEGLTVIASLGSAAFAAARKVEAISRVGIKDPETSAYTFAYFGDVAGREIDRASRYGRRFALLTIGLEGMDRGAAGSEDRVRLRRAVTDAILDAVRDSDVLARVEDDELYLLLPETGLLGALACRRRILRHFLEGQELRESGVVATVGIAVYPTDGADLGRLLRASRNRAERSMKGVWQRLELHGLPFWSAVDAVLGGEDDAALARDGSVALHPELMKAHDALSLARHAVLPASAMARVGGQLVSDAVKRRLTGTLYVAGDASLEAEVARALGRQDARLRAWILGRREGPGVRLRLPVDDPRLGERALFIMLTEIGGYLLLGRPLDAGTWFVFHSADLDLVDGLTTSIQHMYHLQPELQR